MSEKYKISDKEKAYYVTLTVVNWIDVFIRKNHKLKIVEALKYCRENKGLTIYAWVLMSSHLHMVARADSDFTLSEILRDFKKYTAKAIIKQIKEEPESRKAWLLRAFAKTGDNLKRIKNYKFWQDGNQPKEIQTNEFLYEKIYYIHMNPVKEMIIEHPEDYMFSSARNYAHMDNLLDVELVDNKLIAY